MTLELGRRTSCPQAHHGCVFGTSLGGTQFSHGNGRKSPRKPTCGQMRFRILDACFQVLMGNLYVGMYVCIYLCMYYTFICICIYIYIYNIHLFLPMHGCSGVQRANPLVYTHILIHNVMHTCMHTYSYIHKCTYAYAHKARIGP
jgi:hypothetical protein